jgi:uncharacterized protein (TIGR01777 family)
MKILVAGATGMVGSALVPALASAGHTVCRLVRPETRTEGRAAVDVAWNPGTGDLGRAAAGADAVVNLAGASIAGGRWTAARKQLLRTSRVDTTRALVSAIGKMNPRPSVLISASAIGFYGDRGDEVLDEASPPGTGFLAAVAQDWETAALGAERFRTRVVIVRFGIVLARDAGALPRIVQPFRFGVGGRIASGKQWMSWIALDDVVGVLKLALLDAMLAGQINVVAPEPVTNLTFTREVAKVLRRPAFFPAPAFALRLVMGEMADGLLLGSQRVIPGMLLRVGYKFSNPQLAPALGKILAARPE